jgi:hypothetical protein
MLCDQFWQVCGVQFSGYTISVVITIFCKLGAEYVDNITEACELL